MFPITISYTLHLNSKTCPDVHLKSPYHSLINRKEQFNNNKYFKTLKKIIIHCLQLAFWVIYNFKEIDDIDFTDEAVVQCMFQL